MKRKWSADEVQQWYLLTGDITYANREDANVVVRKPNRLGWTLNWENPAVWLIEIVFAMGMLAVLALFS